MTSKARGKSRGNGEGSIYQRKSDDKWCAAITLESGKQKVLYGRTRQDVAGKLTAALAARSSGLPLVGGRQTVGQFLQRWLQDAAKPKLRPRTFESYAMIVNRHLVPALGRRPLVQLSPGDVQSYMNAKQKDGRLPRKGEKRAKGLSARTVQYHRAVLRKALSQALKWGDVSRNVATLVDPPRLERHEAVPMDPEQAEQFLQVVRGHRLEALFTVALALGLRQGEALGLRWEDINLDAAELRVRKQVQRIDGQLQLVDPKTEHSRRPLSLPAFAVDALRAHRVRQIQERLLGGSLWQERGLVFSTIRGAPMDASNLIGQYHRLPDKAGLPRRRFHDLRHTCATLLLVQGEDLNVVKEILGHSQISLTADLYQHVLPSLKKGAADKMQALLGAGR